MTRRSILEELRRRNVFRVAFAYLAGSWLVIQIADIVVPRLGFSDAAVTNIIILIGIGFIPVLVFAWLFQRTPQGLRRDSNHAAAQPEVSHKRFDQGVIALLVLAVGFFAVDKFLWDPARDKEQIHQAREAGRSDALVQAFGNRSIAVLPFVNLSSDPEQEYFSDGIAEELLNLLAKIPELRVISRSTAFTFKGADIIVPEVARKLNVAHVLEGSVRRSGNKLRITAQLIDARTDTHLWSETYDREMGDVFAIQDEISAKVVAELKLKILGDGPKSDEIDPLAYDLYLRARHLLHQSNGEDDDIKALGLLEEVVKIEPDWVPGIAELLRAVFRKNVSNPEEREENRKRGWSILETLERVDTTGARALAWRAWLVWAWKGETQLAARYLERSSEIDPGSVDLLRGETVFLMQLDRYEEALAISEYLIINDPACGPCVGNLAFSLRAMGRHRESAERLENILDWQPPTNNSYWSLGISWLVAGEPAKALHYFEMMNEPDDQNLGRLLALYDLGRAETFEKDFARFRDLNQSNPEGIARVYAWTGNSDEAFRWLDIMVEEQGREWVADVKTDLYSKIKSDPRWQAFLERNGQADEQMEAIVFNPVLPPEIQQLLKEEK